MSMTYEQNVGQVQIEGDEITFTDKTNEKVYRTTATNDPDRTQRLYENGAQFQEIDTQPGLLTSILVGWVLPLLPFLLIGWFINRRMQKIHGRRDGMMFGMGGGSNAKMYVPSSTGIRFADVAGEDEAKELLSEIVDFLHDPEKYRPDRRQAAQGRPAGGPSGHRQDPAGQGGGRRGQRALLLHCRQRVCGDVRGPGCRQGAGPVQAGQ